MILINPHLQRLTEVQCVGDADTFIRSHLNCTIAALQLNNGDDFILVNASGVETETSKGFFTLQGAPKIMAGQALIVCINARGKFKQTRLSLTELEKSLTWLKPVIYFVESKNS